MTHIRTSRRSHAHTIAEVLDLAAFVLVFAAAVYSTVHRSALEMTNA